MTAPTLDGPPMESPLDVERVEWVPATAEALEVRLAGRWRTGPPGDPVELLVADGEDRRRFRAVAAGTDEGGRWTARFAVPVELRGRLGASLGLSAGGRELSLPAASPGPGDEGDAPPAATVVEPQVLAELRARREGLSDEALLRRAQAAEAAASTLERQLELLESRLRDGGGGAEARAALEREAADLRVRLQAAEAHAAALGAEMDAIRREGAEDRVAAGAQLQAEIDRLRLEAASVTRLLEAERVARDDAEQRLARQADRVGEAEATVTLLERELERRASVQTAVQAELAEVREALARVREQARAGGDEAVRSTLEELKATAAGLHARVEGLEASERTARAEVRDAEQRLEAMRGEAAVLRSQLEDERRARARAEAALGAELARGRDALDGRLAELERELRDRIAGERRDFEARAAELEALTADVRARLAAAVAELEGRLAGERRMREHAEAARDAAAAEAERVKREVAADLEQAAGEREALRERLAELEREVARRDDELAALRAPDAEAAERERAIEALVADVVAMGSQLREGFGRSLEEVAARIEDEVEALRAQLDEERARRREAEDELVAERERGATWGAARAEAAMTRSELETARRELAAAQEQLAARRAPAAGAGEPASRLVADLEAARLKVREAAEQEAEASGPAAEVEGVEAAAEAEAIEPAAEAEAVEPATVDGATEAPEPATVDGATEAPKPAAQADVAAAAAPADLDEAAVGSEPAAAADEAADDDEAASAEPAAEPLVPRAVPPFRRGRSPWLAPALARAAERDPSAAAELLLALLPAQVGAVKDPLTYGLIVDGHGAYRVQVGPLQAQVERVVGAPALGDVQVRVAGHVAALAPLAAGGAGRKLRGARVDGSKRRLRKLLKARREPLDLAEAASRRISPEPAALLAVLAAGVDPSWTSGRSFSVVYDVAGEQPVAVRVADRAPLLVEPVDGEAAEPPTATVAIARSALLPLMTRVGLPDGERALVTGDIGAVERLHAWFDRAQGLPAD